MFPELRFILPLQRGSINGIMEKNQWTTKQMRSGLSSNDSNVLINTLQQVENSGDPSLIPELVSLLRKTQWKEISDRVAVILNNLKYQASAGKLVNEIRKAQQPEVISLLVSACWKNGLDFSPYIDDFIEVFLHNDYPIALDALTVIENATRNLERSPTESRIERLKQQQDQAAEEKKMLVEELIHILKNKISQ